MLSWCLVVFLFKCVNTWRVINIYRAIARHTSHTHHHFASHFSELFGNHNNKQVCKKKTLEHVVGAIPTINKEHA